MSGMSGMLKKKSAKSFEEANAEVMDMIKDIQAEKKREESVLKIQNKREPIRLEMKPRPGRPSIQRRNGNSSAIESDDDARPPPTESDSDDDARPPPTDDEEEDKDNVNDRLFPDDTGDNQERYRPLKPVWKREKGEKPLSLDEFNKCDIIDDNQLKVARSGLRSYQSMLDKKAAAPKKKGPAYETRNIVVTDYYLGWNFWLDLYESGKITYMLIGNEIGNDKNCLHLQIYICLKRKARMSTIYNMVHPCHVEKMKGTVKDQKAYCTKSGQFIELGEAPKQGERNDLKDIHKQITEDDVHPMTIALEQPEHFGRWCTHRRSWNELYSSSRAVKSWREFKHIKDVGYMKPRPRNAKPEVICICGDPGTGKTQDAVWIGGAKRINMAGTPGNRFINGYNGEAVVVFDDWVPELADRQLLLDLTDVYEYTANVKGGSINWNPMRIYFTNNVDQKGFMNGDRAWIRRVSKWINKGFSKEYAQAGSAEEMVRICEENSRKEREEIGVVESAGANEEEIEKKESKTFVRPRKKV